MPALTFYSLRNLSSDELGMQPIEMGNLTSSASKPLQEGFEGGQSTRLGLRSVTGFLRMVSWEEIKSLSQC